MKINIVVTEAGKIIAKNTIIKLGVNPFDIEGSKIPISIYQKKGDLLVAKGYSNPAAISVGSDGQVLVSDSTEAAGVRWKTMQLGTITLSNSETFAIISGTVVTQGTVSGTFRIATSADTTNLYVASEDILPGRDGVLYATSGVSCNVRVTDAAVAIGDKLAVSEIDGVAETTTGTHFAIAVTGKSAGQIGTVSCILVNTNVATLDVPGGGTGRLTLSSNNILVGNGVDPIKLVPTHSGAFYATGDNTEPSFNTLPIAQGGTGATTDVNLFQNKNLNSLNIDTEFNYNYAVAISEGGHGTRPAEVWVLVVNFYTNHFIAQIAQEITVSTTSHSSGRTWVRERYIGSTATWSTWKLLTSNKNAGAHNSVYRGVSLGTSVSAAQYSAIAAGTFDDMYVGDYWTINDVVWRIAAFDYYLTTGDTACNTHHVVIVPDTNLYSHVMNDSNVTTGGYVGSKMHTKGLAQALSTIKTAFGESHILSHRQFLCNAVTNGYPSGGSWYDSKVELMTEQNVYGGKVMSPMGNGATIVANYTVDKSQYPLFVHDPHMISNRQYFWLRDVVSAADFATVDGTGRAAYSYASNGYGVRPAFSIIG